MSACGRVLVNLCLSMLIVFTLAFTAYNVAGKTIYVGGSGENNYTSIQDAIDDADSGDTVYVHSGVYYENINLYKPLKLIGEDKKTTVIDGMKKGDTVFISSDNCTIQGFTIRNCSEGSFSNVLVQANDAEVLNNIIIGGNGWGMYLYYASSATIVNNTFLETDLNIIGNLSSWNTHTIENNTVNDKKLWYFKDLSNFTFSSSSAGEVIFANCTNSTIEDVEVSGVDEGIVLGFSSNNLIKNNHVYGNYFGIRLNEADKNRVENNTVDENKYGVYLTHSSHNYIVDNMIKYNSLFGCWICCGSLNNIIYRNNFTLNNKSAYDAYSNKWYLNYVGNYWSDYNGSDADDDGIGDTPYSIPPDGRNKDMYPVVCFDKIKTPSNEKKGTPGFEFLFVISAVSLIVLWRKTRRI
ncbi:MAG: hypothetical protein FE035_01645 [Thermoplasmata archaeon]|nr:MAG: hypothetical protein FE035_01645 [Thermoplasmata archaeon]